jgi:serine/threonine-protein kinase
MADSPTPTFLALQTALAGRYALVRELGRGGMGVVYLARDLALDRPVAVKLLPPAQAAEPGRRARFLREARTAARLSHPHIVPIHSVEEHGEFALFVMGYVEGETLAERVRRAGPLAPEEAMRILQEVAWALAYAHQHGVVHRDVKPANILLERGTGRALVADFGIAQVSEADGTPADCDVAGTARYMSPEHMAGEAVDGRSDLYSLGVTAFEALTGRSCEPGSGLRHGVPVSMQPVVDVRPELPSRLGAIVDRCRAIDPAARFGSGEELADALDAARSRRREIPLAVQRYREHFETYTGEVASYAAVGTVFGIQTVLAEAFLEGTIFPDLFLYISAAVVLLLGFRSIGLIQRTRALLREGYGIGDLLSSVRAELPAEPEPNPWGRRILRVTGLVAWLTAFWTWTQVDAGQWGPVVDALWYAIVTIVPLAWIKTGIARMLRPPARHGGWWAKLWWTVMPKKFFLLAGGKGSAEPVSMPDQPTEVALGNAAQELFERLPPALRERFDDVPEVLHKLERAAALLRARGADPGGVERLPATLAALESIRLDLLRLGAGASTGDELTADLEAAREVGERVNALLDAHRELDRPTPTPA